MTLKSYGESQAFGTMSFNLEFFMKLLLNAQRLVLLIRVRAVKVRVWAVHLVTMHPLHEEHIQKLHNRSQWDKYINKSLHIVKYVFICLWRYVQALVKEIP